jgi:hypothetical protein
LSTGRHLDDRPADDLGHDTGRRVVQLVEARPVSRRRRYALFDQQVSVSAPAQTAATPAADGVPAAFVGARGTSTGDPGVAQRCVGAELRRWVGATVANPDPCVKQRSSLSGGRARITVLSSQAST